MLAYTGTALTTSAIIHGSNMINSSYNYFFKPTLKSVEMVLIKRLDDIPESIEETNID